MYLAMIAAHAPQQSGVFLFPVSRVLQSVAGSRSFGSIQIRVTVAHGKRTPVKQSFWLSSKMSLLLLAKEQDACILICGCKDESFSERCMLAQLLDVNRQGLTLRLPLDKKTCCRNREMFFFLLRWKMARLPRMKSRRGRICLQSGSTIKLY